MKKLFLFLAFFGAVAFTTNAQTCTKSASATKSSCCAKTKAAAAKLAAADATIEAKTCEKSGTVSYYRNYTCSVSGKTSTTQVEYDAKTAKFVNMSPSKMTKEAAAGGKAEAKKKSCAPSSCTKKSAKAVKTSAATKKSCDPAACTKSTSAKSCTKSTGAKAKMVKN